MNEFLTDEHKLYRIAIAESNVDRKWDRVVFSNESIFCSLNDGPVVVYRPRESVTTVNICLLAHAVVVCLFSVGAGSPMMGLECSIE